MWDLWTGIVILFYTYTDFIITQAGIKRAFALWAHMPLSEIKAPPRTTILKIIKNSKIMTTHDDMFSVAKSYISHKFLF